MNANDYIFNQVDKTALAKGVREKLAHDAAVMAMSDYAKGRFKTATKLIEDAIKQAVKLNS